MFPMEEDDIFQVDKADLIQGPTLAELNANDESLLTDFNFDDFVMPMQTSLGGRGIKPVNGSNVLFFRISYCSTPLICERFFTDRGRGSISDG